MTEELGWHGIKWMGLSEGEEVASEGGRGQKIDPYASGGASAGPILLRNDRIETALFRCAFTLEEPDARLILRLSASGRYRLWVNGVSVTYGPCRGGRWEKYVETVDLTPYLQVGKNVLAAKVVAYPPFEGQKGMAMVPFGFYGNTAGPLFVAKGRIIGASGQEQQVLSTGQADWRVVRDRSMGWDAATATIWMGAMEVVDLEKSREGWQLPGFVAAGWPAASVCWSAEPNGYGEMLPFPLSERPIPIPVQIRKRFVREMPIRQEDGPSFTFGLPQADLSRDLTDADCQTATDPAQSGGTVEIPSYSRRVLELDAGMLTTAFFRLALDGGAGSRISLCYSEAYTLGNGERRPVKDVRDDAVNGRLSGVTDVLLASGQAHAWEPFLFRTFRFVRMVVETAGSPLTLRIPEFVETGYPLQILASFRSREEWTKRVWDMSARTLARCMHETYVDCPYYEQLQYTMDTRLQMLFTYASSGDDRLALKAIGDFHSSLLPEGMLQSRWPSDPAQVIPAFALHWIFMLEDHWEQSGAPEAFLRYRATVDAVLDWFERKTNADGLAVNLGHWEYADWVEEWDSRAGVPTAVEHGPATLLNLTLAAAQRSGARLMHATGRPDVAAEYEARAQRIFHAVEAHCWSEEEGMYMEGPGFREYSQHTQVWAVLSGMAVGKRARAVMEGAVRKPGLYKCTFPWMYMLFRALELAGLYAETEALWEMWKVLIPQRLTTIPESPFETRSDCHAWGALPLWEFPRRALGISPGLPGWERIDIAPMALFLGEAAGEAPTPKGPVLVSWCLEGSAFSLEYHVPEGVPVEIRMPDGTTHQLDAGDVREGLLSCVLPDHFRQEES